MKQSKQVIEKRRNQIIELLQQAGEIQVSELCECFGVSSVTIRRDLEQLQSQGIISRSYGKAILKRDSQPLYTFSNKQTMMETEKQKIAQFVLPYIQDGDTVFTNSGTTLMELLKLLDGRQVNIVTNNVLAYECCPNLKGNLIYTGGVYYDTSKACLGDFAVSIIRQIYANLCILGVNGISADAGATTSIFQETILNNAMVSQCNGKVIVLADSSKVGKIFSFKSAELKDIDVLITGNDADEEELERIREKGVETYQVETM